MADFLAFLPVVEESLADIRARLDTAANAGLLPTDPAYLDTVEGGFFYDLTQPAALEAERLWDFLSTEVVAVVFVQFAWGPYLDFHGEMLGVPRKPEVTATGTITFTGTNGVQIAQGTQVVREPASVDDDPITFTTNATVTIAGGTASVAITATVAGSQGNVPTATITSVQAPVDGVSGVTNAAPTSGGGDEESDESYRDRLLLEYSQPVGGGTISDYERWALAYLGVGYVTVEPLWGGAGTVRVVVADPDHNPASTATVSGLQAELDPVVGQGHGLAPIGASVTVATVTAQGVTVSATVTFSSGYSLDGVAGTRATRQQIVDAIRGYIDKLDPGEDVVKARVESAFFRVVGVYDVSSVLLNGAGTNVSISSLQVAQSSTITLS